MTSVGKEATAPATAPGRYAGERAGREAPATNGAYNNGQANGNGLHPQAGRSNIWLRCKRCSGSLQSDYDGDLSCLMCGEVYYVTMHTASMQLDPDLLRGKPGRPPKAALAPQQEGTRTRKTAKTKSVAPKPSAPKPQGRKLTPMQQAMAEARSFIRETKWNTNWSE